MTGDTPDPDYDNFTRTDIETSFLIAWTCSSFILGVLGNTFILFATYRRAIKIDPNSLLFIKNLAVSDILFTLIWVLPTLITLCNKESWVLGDELCRVTTYLQYTPAISTICFITMLSLNKFVRCKFPLKVWRMSSRTSYLITVTSWTFGLLHPSIYFFSSLTRSDKREIMLYPPKSSCDYYHGMHLTEHWHRIDMICSIIYTFIPTIVLIGANIGLIKLVTEKGRNINRSNLALIFVVTVVFVCSYSPYVVRYTAPMIVKSAVHKIPGWFKTLMNFVLFVNSWFNLFAYYLTNASFRYFTQCAVQFRRFSLYDVGRETDSQSYDCNHGRKNSNIASIGSNLEVRTIIDHDIVMVNMTRMQTVV